jgi:hypothetical protein
LQPTKELIEMKVYQESTGMDAFMIELSEFSLKPIVEDYREIHSASTDIMPLRLDPVISS